jgi:hypothetical protein
MPLEDVLAYPAVYKWLETNRTSLKPSPSNMEEMVQIGALCFGSEYIYREDLKSAIMHHPSWHFPVLSAPPISFDQRGL